MTSIPLVALRSLQCQDHANNIPPTVLTVHWFLGKRCNYDCSYCSPHTHDAVSPFIDIVTAKTFVNCVEDYCIKNNKKVKWSFTGGEPFIDPGFLDLAWHIKNSSSTEQLNVTTNGSLPMRTYQVASEIFKGITVSIHLERSDEEINSTISNFAQIKNCFISVNLMFIPGQLSRIKTIVQQLKDQQIPVVLRKITPNIIQEGLMPYQSAGPGKKHVQLISRADQSLNKIQWQKNLDSDRADRIKDFYNDTELEYLGLINDSTEWSNCGIWSSDGSYQEINSDALVATDRVNFYGWTCYAGVDNIFIDFDGQIYRGMCQNDGAIGHIKNLVTFVSDATVCKKQWCVCNNDITLRKATQDGLGYINK